MTDERSPLLLAASALALTLGTAACNRGRRRRRSSSSRHRARHRPGVDGQVGRAGRRLLQFANGSWVKNTPIPDDRSRIGGFYLADQEREKSDAASCSTPSSRATPTPTATRARIANYYNAYLEHRRDRPRRHGAGQGRPRFDRAASATSARSAPRSAAPFAPTPIRSTRPITRPRICSASSSRRG